MRLVEPDVFCIGKPSVDVPEMERYLEMVGGNKWLERIEPLLHDQSMQDGEALVEFGGRLCYRSWEPGLNPNVTKVREDSGEYLRNILSSGHGSVTEHGFYVFVFHNVSRVFTHELCRHRAGTSISQESMRYVRLDDIPFWLPEWAKADEDLVDGIMNSERCDSCGQHFGVLDRLEEFQRWMAGHFGLDDDNVPFSEKKAKTSFMRRFAPDGVATSIMWGGNIRAIRHVIEMRTALGAEEEIRLVFDKVAEHMQQAAPMLFSDYTRTLDGEWVSDYRKV